MPDPQTLFSVEAGTFSGRPAANPAWRAARWLGRNPWFVSDVVPELQRRVRATIAQPVPRLLPLHRMLPAQRSAALTRDPDDWIE